MKHLRHNRHGDRWQRQPATLRQVHAAGLFGVPYAEVEGLNRGELSSLLALFSEDQDRAERLREIARANE